jgi:hypothetical protein
MVIARSRRVLGDRDAARQAAERAARASAAGNGMEHERTREARALVESLR